MDEILKESLKKKKQLEDLIETEVDANKQSRRQLEKEIGSLQARIDDLAREEANMSDTVHKANLEAQRSLLTSSTSSAQTVGQRSQSAQSAGSHIRTNHED